MATGHVSYDRLKQAFLGSYFATCRDHRAHGKLTLDEIILDVHEELAERFPSPAENLMVNMIGLTLTGGWFPELEVHCRTGIEKILLSHPLDAIVGSLAAGEKDDFLHDLHLLKIV